VTAAATAAAEDKVKAEAKAKEKEKDDGMKAQWMTFALCVLLVAGACSNDGRNATADAEQSTPAAADQKQADLTPEQLGELGAQIRKNPNDAKRLLTQHGLNEQTFEQAVRKVSEDPAASKRYAESYKKAGA
jgi:ABC-type enterochelin transport system substrate-binding protein